MRGAQRTATDVAVAGDGLMGVAMACWLARDGWRVTHLRRRQATAQPSPLAIALGAHGKRALAAAGLWQALLPAANPFHAIESYAADGTELRFDSRDACLPEMGWVIRQHELMNALDDAMASSKVQQLCQGVEALSAEEGELLLADGSSLRASLIIAADGANSAIRGMAGIGCSSHDYRQSALVCTVRNAAPRFGVARQWFLRQGPLALLPLPGHDTECLLWSLPQQDAERMAALGEAEFSDLAGSVTGEDGRLRLLGERLLHPLRRQHADSYRRGRVLLLGDSAHQPHPLAGMGANLGLMDASCLRQLLRQARLRGHDPASAGAAYERRRRRHNAHVLNTIDFIQAAYGARNPLLGSLRALGLRGVNRCAPAKAALARAAAGMSMAGARGWYAALS